MKVFKDKEGREWTIDVTVDAIKRVRAALGINLLEVVDGQLVGRLMDDPVLLVDVLYVLCKAQADQRSVTDEQFGQAMAGDAIDRATSTFFEDLTNFFPNGKRRMLEKALKKVETLQTKVLALASQTLDEIDVDQMLKKWIDSHGVSPASPESTPAP